MQITRIKLGQIDFSDNTYNLLPPHCLPDEISAELLKSIEQFGVLHPPLIKEKTTSSFAIVSGRKRLTALAQLASTSSCACIKITEKTSPIDTLALGLEESLLSRSLSAIEQAVFFAKALQLITIDKLAATFLPRMGLTASNYLVHKGLKLLDLEEPISIAVHKGQLDDKVAFELTRLPFSDRLALFEVIETLKLSVGNQKKLVLTSRELAARSNSTIFDQLNVPELVDIMNHPETNIPQKTTHLMKWLNKRKFPRMTEAEKEFQEFSKSLHLPDGIQLNHSPSFEKDDLTVTLSCTNKSHFLSIWEKIKDLFPGT